MVQKELPHFYIGSNYGGNQDWMRDPMMRLGGCGALAACDTCIVLAREFGFASLVPFDVSDLTKADYQAFGKLMKPYMPPRRTGINRLATFQEEFQKYLDDRAEETGERPVAGVRLMHKTLPWQAAAEQIKVQIDKGIPMPTLLLHHEDRRFKFYLYHWFMMNGYKELDDGTLYVKFVTYGKSEWLPFKEFWNTGYPLEDGGVVLVDIDTKE